MALKGPAFAANVSFQAYGVTGSNFITFTVGKPVAPLPPVKQLPEKPPTRNNSLANYFTIVSHR